MLNSVIISQKGDITLDNLCDLMLLWWKNHNEMPDYFFFQILFDVYPLKEVFPLVSDTRPHNLQQFNNDPNYSLFQLEDIFRLSSIHKLSYK